MRSPSEAVIAGTLGSVTPAKHGRRIWSSMKRVSKELGKSKVDYRMTA
jgi:hypothetical protein